MNSSFFPRGKLREKSSEADQIGRNVSSGDDKSDSDNNHQHPQAQSEGERFTEHSYSEEYGRQGFQGSQDGGGGRADVLDGLSGA